MKLIFTIAFIGFISEVIAETTLDAKSLAILSSAKAQVNHERGAVSKGRSVKFLGEECKLNVAPLDGFIDDDLIRHKPDIRVVVGDVIPVCEAAR